MHIFIEMADMAFDWEDWKVNGYRTQYQRRIILQDIRPYGPFKEEIKSNKLNLDEKITE